MPRGDNPNSRANLIVPSSIQARKNGSKGGINKARKDKVIKTFQESMQEAATPEVKDKINKKLLEMAMRGNIRAVEMVLRIIGENTEDKRDDDNVKAFLDALKG